MHVLDVVIAATVIIVKGDQCRFLGNYSPIPPLSQHCALSEKQVLMIT